MNYRPVEKFIRTFCSYVAVQYSIIFTLNWWIRTNFNFCPWFYFPLASLSLTCVASAKRESKGGGGWGVREKRKRHPPTFPSLLRLLRRLPSSPQARSYHATTPLPYKSLDGQSQFTPHRSNLMLTVDCKGHSISWSISLLRVYKLDVFEILEAELTAGRLNACSFGQLVPCRRNA